jgi:hypothetical protein
MKGFFKSAAILATILAGVLGVSYHFDIQITIKPITITKNGPGNITIDNSDTQGVTPVPSPSPATSPVPAATPEPPPKTAENEPAQSAPTPEPRRLEVAETGENEQRETAPDSAPIRRRSQRAAMAHAPVFDEQPQPVYTRFPQQPSVRQRSCPTVVVRRPAVAAYDVADMEPQSRPAYPDGTYSRSYSRSVVKVNGRVVSSVTKVDGRVVSRSGSSPTPADDDEW